MTYPPQQPEDGWSDQQPEQPVDPFGQGAQGQAAQQQYPQQPAYGQQQYDQQQYHQEPPTDQTQALPPSPQSDNTQVIGQQQYQPQPEQPVQPFAAAPVPGDPNQYQQPADPNQGQYYQPQQQFQPQQPPAAPVSGDPNQGQYYDPNQGQYYQPQQQFQPQQPPAAPVSADPNQGQYYQPPVSASPASGQPFQQTPPGVPESPFAAAPNPAPAPAPHLPTPVSASPTSAQPWGGGVVPQFTPKRKGIPAWTYVVGAVVVVIALAVSAVFIFDIGGSGKAEPPGDSADDEKKEDKPVPITNDDSGLTYMSLPHPWGDITEMPGFEELPGFASVSGQSFITESGEESGEGWMGVFAVGELDAKAVKYENVDSLAGSVTELADLIDENNWKDPTDEDREKNLDGLTRDQDLVAENIRVDGRRAVLATYHVSWKSESVTETGSQVTIGALDMGDGKVAGFFVDLPDTMAEEHGETVQEALMTMQFD